MAQVRRPMSGLGQASTLQQQVCLLLNLVKLLVSPLGGMSNDINPVSFSIYQWSSNSAMLYSYSSSSCTRPSIVTLIFRSLPKFGGLDVWPALARDMTRGKQHAHK